VNIKAGGKAQGTTTGSKVSDCIKATGEYSVEVWRRRPTTQEDATRRYSGGVMSRT
jgi:hypothetical protein